MKNIDVLKSFFENDLQDDIKRLDKKRLSIVKQIMVMELLVLAVFVFSIYMCVYFKLSPGFYILFTISCAAFGWMILKSFSANEQFHKDFKNTIIERMINLVDKSLDYDATKKISLNDFKYSAIFDGTYKRYRGDDLVWGQIDEMQIQFCELDVASGKGISAKLDYVFHGLFLVSETTHNLSDEIVVLPKANLNLKTLNKELPIVHVSHSQFETIFQIRSKNEKIVSEIFTDSFMTQMAEFAQKSKHNIYFSFHGNRAYFATELKRKLFEPKIFQTLNDFKVIKEYFTDLYAAISIIEQLKIQYSNKVKA